jgi:phosphoribosylglycinamide formyltransferase-1
MAETTARIAVFISGSGSGLQALIDAAARGELCGKIAWVVASTNKAFGLERAAKAGIESFVFRVRKYATPDAAGADILTRLHERNIDYIALAGYLSLLPAEVVRSYRNRITNIHPALLPRFGGKGMFGHHVHEAVISAGETESGPTVHLVNEAYDEGAILEQVRVPVLPGDTPETLAARVLVEEHKLYPKVLDKLIKGAYRLNHD